jgi:hypothetical protein
MFDWLRAQAQGGGAHQVAVGATQHQLDALSNASLDQPTQEASMRVVSCAQHNEIFVVRAIRTGCSD